MSERLLIRLQADGALAWLAMSGEGRALSGTNSGAPPPQALERAQRIVVLVPAEEVVLLETARMNVSRVQFAKAVPFALEDQLVSAVEDLHFAVPERPGGERVCVVVVARETLRGWLARLAQGGIRADALYAETQALPFGEDQGSVLIEDHRALWRGAGAQSGACDPDSLAQWLGTFVAGDARKRLFDVYDFRAAAPLPLPMPVRYHANQLDPLAFLATHLAGEPEVNLLQGEFAPPHARAPVQRLWRKAAALAAAAVVLLFAQAGADCWRLARQSGQLDSAARTLLHGAFPEMDKVSGNPRDVMQSALAGLRGGDAGGLMHLLGQIAPLLASTTRTTLTALEYHNGTLEIGLRAPDVPTLDLMRERIAGLPGFKVEVTSANTGESGVDGRLRIVGGKP
jgi:general secretion pathway protein L